MTNHFTISESLYSAASNAICSLQEHYTKMLKNGVSPEDVLSRMVRHIDAIDRSTASEESKTKAKAELLAFATKHLTTADGWPVAQGLFDGWTPPNFVRESVDEAATPSTTHVLHHKGFNKFHGAVNGKAIKTMTEPQLKNHLVRDHGYDKDKASEMIGKFKSGCPSGETLHRSSHSVDGALHHAQHALSHHLAGNHPMRDRHLKVADAFVDQAVDSLRKDDAGVLHPVPKKLEVLHRTLKAFK